MTAQLKKLMEQYNKSISKDCEPLYFPMAIDSISDHEKDERLKPWSRDQLVQKVSNL